MRSLAHLIVSLALVGCTGSAGEPPGPLARQAAAAAAVADVPRDLLLAIAKVEGGLTLPRYRAVRDDDHVPVGGILELRHGAFNSLARGAELVHADERALRQDTDLGTLAGALVLAELGAQGGARLDDLASWRPAVATLSGLGDGPYRDDYVARVFITLREGGRFAARDGEWVWIPPHPELPAPPPVVHQELGNPPSDFLGAVWLPTDCTNKCTPGRPDGNAAVDMVIIHDTEGGWNASVATLQYDPNKSVHYLIDADGGRIGQFLHETDTAWQAGNWCYNKHSIGIEHVGKADDPNGYATALYLASATLVQSIRTRWSIPLDRLHILGHYQVPNGNVLPLCSPPCTDALGSCITNTSYGGGGHHYDPGLYWQWCQYMQMLGGSCTCNDTYPLWNCTTDKTEAVRCVGGQVQIKACVPCEPRPNGVDDICHAALPPDLATVLDASVPSDQGVALPDPGARDGGLRADVLVGGCQLATGRPASGRGHPIIILLLVATGASRVRLGIAGKRGRKGA